MKKNNDILQLDCYVRHETLQAYLVETGVGKKAWVPKRFVDVTRRGGSMGECDLLQIPEWLALDKGII